MAQRFSEYCQFGEISPNLVTLIETNTAKLFCISRRSLNYFETGSITVQLTHRHLRKYTTHWSSLPAFDDSNSYDTSHHKTRFGAVCSWPVY